MSFDMSVGVLDGGHVVEEDQRTEPGVPLAEQPHGHGIQALPMAWGLEGSVGVHERVAVYLRVPVHATSIDAGFTDSEGQAIENFESIHHRTETVVGLGDVRLGVVVGALLGSDVPGAHLSVRLGLSLPTGEVEADPFALGEAGQSHQHTFFGTDVVMPELRVTGGYAWSDVALFARLDGRFALYEGAKGYRPSTVLAGAVGVSSGFGLSDWTFRVAQEAFHEEAAEWDGTPAENSGRTELLASVGIHWRFTESWSIGLTAKTPYATWSRGDQFSFPFLGGISLAWESNLFDRNDRERPMSPEGEDQ